MAYGIKEIKGNNDCITLKKASINGNVCGSYAEISIHQVYENSGENDIEGVYVFPIPKTAIISGFEAEIGGRTLRAIVEEKEKAFKVYENAKLRGDNTFLLEEFKSQQFKISIGKIIKGEAVSIKLSYIDELEYKDNTYKLVVPALFDSEKTLHSRLNMMKNNILNKSNISELAELDFKTNILVESLCRLDFNSLYHKVSVERDGDNIAKVTLNENYNSMEKDFVLLMKEQERLEADGMVYEYKENDQDKGIVYIRMFPKLDEYEEEIEENYVFLLDISDTMKGEKLEQAKNALQLCIRNLSQGDKFDIVAIGEQLRYFSEEEMADFNADTLRSASEWIDNLEIENDADIFGAIKYALENEGGHNTILIFTDDQVEEEEEILSYVREHLEDNRIFAFGVDSETNNYFLNKLAHESFGKAEFINKGERIEDIVLRQFKRIQSPEIDDVNIDWGNLKIESTYPRTIEYMYNREPLSIFANVVGEVSGEVTISGKVGNKDYVQKINLDNFNTEENANLLKKVWARKRIKSIVLNMMRERGQVRESMKKKVIELSKNNGIISRETTFIFMELREEPVLGIQLRNIAPIKVNEGSFTDEIGEVHIEDTDTVGFFYKTNNKHFYDNIIKNKTDDNEYLDVRYPRQMLLRLIAKNQFVDGAFVDYEDSSIEDKIETTAMALLAFIIGEEDIDIYFNQLNKSVEFLNNKCVDVDINLNDKIIKMVVLALNRSLVKDILKDKNMQKSQYTIDYLHKILNEREGRKEILNSLTEHSFKRNVISLFNMSKNGNSIEEKIVISNERNSIFDMSKLAVLKGLKDL
ncbi:VIT and vWA domain-containing protein [Clostridium thailandense]|uniref:VIT and vWA domain-containing protein n=1 Tax=Clostridium thailandense TaxID=2794346 RepID=UPI00398995DF